MTNQREMFHVCNAAPPAAYLAIVERNFSDLCFFLIKRKPFKENFKHKIGMFLPIEEGDVWVLGFPVLCCDSETEYRLLHPNMDSEMNVWWYNSDGKKQLGKSSYWSPLVAPNEEKHFITFDDD